VPWAGQESVVGGGEVVMSMKNRTVNVNDVSCGRGNSEENRGVQDCGCAQKGLSRSQQGGQKR